MTKYGDQNGKSRSPAKPRGVAGGYDADFRGYLNITLSDADKAHFADWWLTDQPHVTLEDAASDGVNFSLKIDPKGTGYLASATQRRKSSPNAGLCVTARGSDAALAWGRLLFCLWVLSAHEEWEKTQPMTNPDRW